MSDAPNWDGMKASFDTEGLWGQEDSFRVPVRYVLRGAWYTENEFVVNVWYSWFDPNTGSVCSASMRDQVIEYVPAGENKTALEKATLKVWMQMQDVWKGLPVSTGERNLIQRMSRVAEELEKKKGLLEDEFEFESDYPNIVGEVAMHWVANWKNDGSECELQCTFSFRALIGPPSHTDQIMTNVETVFESEMPGLSPENAKRQIECMAHGFLDDSQPSVEEMRHADPENWLADHPGAHS